VRLRLLWRWVASLVLSVVAGCVAGQETEAPAFTTPEQALDYYIESLRAGDLQGVVDVTYPPATDYNLSGPAGIVEYEITAKKVLDENNTKDYDTLPGVPEYYVKREGDVALDVREVTTDNIENMFTYWFRKIGDSWKLYAWSG
jgi:hypothetical protein